MKRKTVHCFVAAAVIAFSLVMLFVVSASACSCLAATLAEEIEFSTAIFSGLALDIQPAHQDHLTVTILVDACWKGALADTAQVRTGSNSAACGFKFEIGKNYLVFATFGGTSFCSRTHETGPDDPMLDLLGPPKPVQAFDDTWGRLKARYR